MTRKKKMNLTLIVSVFITVIVYLIFNFIMSNATNTANLMNVSSYYSDEKGNKITKTTYSSNESIYSTVELYLDKNNKYSRISIVNNSIEGMQLVLKRVIDESGNDISELFGYGDYTEDNKSYSGIYTNSQLLESDEFYNKSYKFIFEQYISDSSIINLKADENNHYLLQNQYRVILSQQVQTSQEICNLISTSIDLNDMNVYPSITVNETANADVFKPGDTIHYSINFSQDVENQKISNLEIELSTLGLYDLNSFCLKNEDNEDVEFSLFKNTDSDLMIQFNEDLHYKKPFTLKFDVIVPKDIFQKNDFDGYLSNNLNLVGYNMNDTDDIFKVKIDTEDKQPEDSIINCTINSDKQNYNIGDIANYILTLFSKTEISSKELEDLNINISFDKKIDLNNFDITEISLNDEILSAENYSISKTEDGFILSFNELKDKDITNAKIKYAIQFSDKTLIDSNLNCKIVVSKANNVLLEKSLSVKIDKQFEQIMKDANYEVSFTPDKSTYTYNDVIHSTFTITNKDEIAVKNLNIKLLNISDFTLEKILINDVDLLNNQYQISVQNNMSTISLNEIDLNKDDKLVIEYTTKVQEKSHEIYEMKFELISDNFTDYNYSTQLKILRNENRLEEKKTSEKNKENTNIAKQNKVIEHHTQTDDVNLLKIFLFSGIICICSLSIICIRKKK